MKSRIRNTAILCGLALAGALTLGLSEHLGFTAGAVDYRLGHIGHYRMTYATVAALTVVAALGLTPAARLARVLGPLGRRPVLTVGLVAGAGAGWMAYRHLPLARFFAEGAVAGGALFFLLRHGACRAMDAALAWGSRGRWAGWTLAATAAVGVFALNRVLYGGLPHMSDSWARYAHVLMLAQGRWCFPAPPDWQWTTHAGMVNDGVRFCSQYQPGALLIGLVGHRIGSLALVPALMAGGAVGLTYAVGRRLFDAPTAALGALLLLLSANFLLLASSFMEHTPATFFLMLALWLGLRDLEQPRAWNALALGACLGYAGITRSLTTLGWAGPLLVVWGTARWRRWGARELASWGWALLGWTAPMAFLLYFNKQTTGDALLPGYRLAHPRMCSLGFTEFNGHTPLHGLANQWNNLASLSEWLFFWPVTSYLFPTALLALGRWTRRDTVAVLPLAGLVTAYFFYPYQDASFSPRFLSESLPLLTLLAARGMVAVAGHLRSHAPGSAPGAWERTILATVAVLFALALPAASERFERERANQLAGVEAMGRILEPFAEMPDATILFVHQPYSHCALVEMVRHWGGARYLDMPSREACDAYAREHPERRCFVMGYSMASLTELKTLAPGEEVLKHSLQFDMP